MKLQKNFFVRACYAVVSVFFASICSNAAAQDVSGQMSLRVQIFPGNVANIYPFLGVSKGFYKDAGLDVQLVQIGSAPQANAALISKSVDMILTSPDNALVLKSRGFKPVAVVGVTTQPNFVLTARDPASFPNLDKGYPALMDDFSGKKVGVYAPASASERIVKFLLQGAKKPLDTVQFIPVGGPGQAMAGLAGKQLDIASDVFSVGLAAELSGMGKIILDCSLAPCPNSIKAPGAMGLAYFTTESFLNEHEDAVKAFVSAHQRVDVWVHDSANKAELRKEIENAVATPANVNAEKYFEGITDWAVRFFGVTFGAGAFEASQQGMLSTGDLSKPVELDGLIWSGIPKS